MPEKKLFLLDAMALIYRAFFAFNKNPRLTSKGLNTSAVFGFANTLFDLLKKERPTHIGVAFDTMAPTVRHEGFEFYKANRQETPEDLVRSLPYIHELIEALNIPTLSVNGYEADDVVGTLSKRAEKKGFITYMMTSDKDFGQLVSENIYIYKPARFGGEVEILGIREVCEKFSIKRPEQIIDLLGLWGDASDNIPGIPGIGEVTAKKLIAEFDTIENLILNVSKVSNEKLRQKIIDNQEMAFMSKKLATIILDVPIDFDETRLVMESPDIPRLRRLFEELEFRAFGQRIFTWLSTDPFSGNGNDTGTAAIHPVGEHPGSRIQYPASADLFSQPVERVISDITTTPHTYHLIDTPEKRSGLIDQLRQQSSFCFDTETTGLDPNNAELVGMSFCWKAGEAYYIPFPGQYHEAHSIAAEFKEILEEPRTQKIGQNLKYDISILKWYDINVGGPLFDTMLAHYLIQPDARHGMDFLAETYLNYKPVPIESLIGKKGQHQLSMRTVDPDTIKEYAAEDADITLQLKSVFDPMLEKTDTRSLFELIETPLIPVLASMEAEGVNIDSGVLNEYSSMLEKEIKQLEESIFQDAGIKFNVASPKQLGEILYTRLRIVDNPKQTRTKQNSTSEEVLVKMENKHPIINKILDFRELTKLKSTYVDVLPTLVNPRDGRVHTSYNQAVAATGRLSSNNPNLQNIPIRTEKGREIRKAFVARNKNFTLLSADYSQIELRIIAHLSGDKGMIEDFNNDLDIHLATASKVYGVGLDEITRDMRRNAKMVNFGIIYGISAFGLAERLNIPRKEAADIIRQYFSKYPGIKQYMDQTIIAAKRNGYVETMMKRRRYLRDINSGNATVRGFAERNAINAPIQGTAADMIKIAMINIFRELEKGKLKSKMILQVHDELVFDVEKTELEKVRSIVLNGMQNAMRLDVPVIVDINTGNNWLEAH